MENAPTGWTLAAIETFPDRSTYLAAESLHRISATEKALLERPMAFYLSQIANRRIVLALEGGEIIGSVGLLPLSSAIAEISGAWVRADRRWRGIYHTMREELRGLAESHGYRLLATVKPAVPGNIGEVVVDAEFGIFPVPFSELQNLDREAYENCCCCGNVPGTPDCEMRDRQCFLLLQGAFARSTDALLESTAWNENVEASANRKIRSIIGFHHP